MTEERTPQEVGKIVNATIERAVGRWPDPVSIDDAAQAIQLNHFATAREVRDGIGAANDRLNILAEIAEP